jgi:DNA-binding XRE family transcriptional regulator
MGNWLWDRRITEKKARKILANPKDRSFVDLAALLLSRNNIPREVIPAYLDQKVFVSRWPQIKRRMRKDKWNKERIIFWQAIYENLLTRLKKTSFKIRIPKVEPDPFLEKMGREIRSWRKEGGLSQKELADRMKVNQQVISRLERGEDNVSVKYLRRLADALGADVSVTLTSIVKKTTVE